MDLLSFQVIIIALVILTLTIPVTFQYANASERCGSIESIAILLGTLLSLCHLPYVGRILRVWKESVNTANFSYELTLIAPKCFPPYIYVTFFLSLLKPSSSISSSSWSGCQSLNLQYILLHLLGGFYGYIWIRGTLFGFMVSTSRLLKCFILLQAHTLKLLSMLFLEYAIEARYGEDMLDACPYIYVMHMSLMIIISGLMGLSYLLSNVGSVGFILSGPFCYALWQREYLMKYAVYVLKLGSREFNVEEWLGTNECPYKRANLMIWSIPFIMWFIVSFLLVFIRFCFFNRAGPPFTAYNEQAVPFFVRSYALRTKTLGEHQLPAKVRKETSCSICWEEFQTGAEISFVEACYHVYHTDCINKWIEKEPDCPLCKRRIKLKLF